MEEPRMDIGLVGLGLMGTAMSTRLLARGHAVYGFDLKNEAMAAHEARGGVACGSGADVAAHSSVVLVSVPTGADARAACLGDGGIVDGAQPGTLIIDTTTAMPTDGVALADDLRDRSIRYADGCICGSSNMVSGGEALGLVGGSKEDMAAGSAVMDAFCARVLHVGDVGNGRRAKLVVNAILVTNRLAFAEGLVFGEAMGMDSRLLLDVLRSSVAYSKAMDIWGDRMVERHYSEPVSQVWMQHKDVQLIVAEAHQHRAPMPAMAQVNTILQAQMANGMQDADNSSLIEVLRQMAGVTPTTSPQPRES